MFRHRARDESLLSFDEVQAALRSRSYAFSGLQTIPLASVVGSEGRSHDFSRAFRPQGHLLQKLRHLLHSPEVDLSRPIQVFQVDQVYFIRDGHHRVAVALSRGQESIQALVTQVTVRAPITAELDHDEVLRRAQLSHFLQETNLDEHAPDSDFSQLPPELYAVIREHIEVHRYYLGNSYARDFSLVESAASWHDLIYGPLLEVLRQQGVHQEFPRRSDPELYLWLTYHREQLRCRGEYRGDAEVAGALVQRFSERPLVGIFKRIQRVWRAAWAAAWENPEPPEFLPSK